MPEDFYSVICTDINPYIDWQCELLEYSWESVGQPGRLLRLVTHEREATLPTMSSMEVVPIAEKSGRNDGYLAFERIFALQDWMERERPHGSVLILDPDCVFRAPFPEGVTPGSPRATYWYDFPDIRGVQQITWPAIIHTEDLARLLPPWIDFTRSIYGKAYRWESDMFGFVSAATTIGLQFQVEPLSAFVRWPDEVFGGAPMVHYAQDVFDAHGAKIWAKREYRPWDSVAGVDRAKHAYCRDLLGILNRCAAEKRSSAENEARRALESAES